MVLVFVVTVIVGVAVDVSFVLVSVAHIAVATNVAILVLEVLTTPLFLPFVTKHNL